MKKSQIFGVPLMYLLFGVFAIAIIIFGFFGVRWVSDSSKEAQFTNFLLTLQNKLSVQRLKAYAIAQEVFAVPGDVSSVCFVDTTKNFTTFANKRLTEKIAAFSDHNVFMEPLDLYSPQKLQYLTLTHSENPLCVKVMNNKLSLKLEGDGKNTQISALQEMKKEAECVSIIYNGDPDEKMDVVFLGYGYGKNASFVYDVNKYINDVFFKMDAMAENRNKFNFYRIDGADLDCWIVQGLNYIKCDQYRTNIWAANCPHDEIIVLYDRGPVLDLVNPVRSSAVSNLAKINTADNPFVLMHEFGHTFADLADEYVDNYYQSYDFNEEDYPNCDITPCEEWNGVSGTGCYNGCSLNAYFRPTETSIMRELSSQEYGPANTQSIGKVLESYR
ncbi:MAG: hypothetical protein ABIJ08_03385 [Nanoarchaeota archaeon]